MHWKAAVSVLWNGSESGGGGGSSKWDWLLRRNGWIPFESAPKTEAAQKIWLFYKVHEEREKKYWSNGDLWGLLLWCPVAEYCVFCWNSRDSFENPVKEFCCPPTDEHGTVTNLLTDFILIYEFLFPRTYSIFISYIYLFWESIFTGMR